MAAEVKLVAAAQMAQQQLRCWSALIKHNKAVVRQTKNPIQKLQPASQLIFQAAAILSRRKGWLSSDRGAGCVLQHSSDARQFAVSLCSAC